MDFTTQFRRTFLAAAPHTFYTATAWLASGLIGELISKTTAIIFFIVSASLTFPAGELVRKLFKAPNVLSSDNKLGTMFMLSAFGIPLCYPLIYFVCQGNVNLFFPAFSILVGAHYLIFVYGYGLKSFAVLSLLMVLQGTYIGKYLPDTFGLSAFITASLLYVFGVYHYIIVKKENHEQH